MTATATISMLALDAALDALDRAEDLLGRARRTAATDPAAAFELCHRAALRTAGVVIERENRRRRRRLPLNAWRALTRCGADHVAWAEQMRPLVAERDRLSRADRSVPDPSLLREHLALTSRRIEAVRMELMDAALPTAALAG